MNGERRFGQSLLELNQDKLNDLDADRFYSLKELAHELGVELDKILKLVAANGNFESSRDSKLGPLFRYKANKTQI